jgi:hypothetical protein
MREHIHGDSMTDQNGDLTDGYALTGFVGVEN